MSMPGTRPRPWGCPRPPFRSGASSGQCRPGWFPVAPAPGRSSSTASTAPRRRGCGWRRPSIARGWPIVAQFMERSRLAPRVAGLVLDAPVLDWKDVLSYNATEMGFPSTAAVALEWAIGARIDADWDGLDALRRPQDFQLPILLFHGTEDDTVPIADSDDFAALLPRWVTYYRVPRAGHTEAWNVDPGLYERRLGAFLARAVPLPGIGG